MKLNNLTIPEIEYYRTFCNFDKEEEELFELRRKNIPLAQCAEILNYENIKNLSSRMINKAKSVTNTKRMNEWIENVYWKNILKNKE